MRAEYQDRALGNLFDGFDENRAAAPQLVDDITVVNDFMMHVNRAAVGFERQLDDVYRSHHPGAESSRPNAHQRLRTVSSLNVRKRQLDLPKLVFYLKLPLPATSRGRRWC